MSSDSSRQGGGATDTLRTLSRATVWRVLAAWSLLALLFGWWAVVTRVGVYREQMLTTVGVRNAAVKETVAASFRQLSALPLHLARRAEVVEFLRAAAPEGSPGANAPAGPQIEDLLRGIGEDFGVPLAALVDAQGRLLIGGGPASAAASPGERGPPRPGLDLSARTYVRDALAQGAGMQFLLGRVTGVPGMYFAHRVEAEGRTLGVAVVKQDADVINRLVVNAQDHVALLTDANNVVVLGSRPDLLLRRLPGGATLDEAAWRDVYWRVPTELPWQLTPLVAGNQRGHLLELDGVRHAAQGLALPGTPLTAWALVPLAEERLIFARISTAMTTIWLFGCTLIWLGWRRIEATESRVESEARFAALFEHAPVGCLYFTARGGISHCNAAAMRLFGAADAVSLRGLSLWTPPLSPPQQPDGHGSRERALELMRSHRQTRDRVQSHEWRFARLGEGGAFDAEVAVVALEWDGVPRYCALIQDVTLRRQSEAAMREARAAAEAASRTKSSFLANMSHELRTPMNAIIGMTHLALEDGLPDKQRGYVAKAHGAARGLLQILNDILDVSKIEAGQMVLERVDFEVDTLIAEMADVLSLKADEKGLELLFTAAPELPRRLVGDPTRLRQILVNLGGNAIKFTDRGEVTVGMQVDAQDEHEVELHGWVRDTGVGLTEEQVARLFKPFSQGDESTTRRFGGTGLGLVISRELAQRMGGRLWVESRPGAGATFHFTARLGTTVPRAWVLGGLGGKRVLLVDDSAAALDVLGHMLETLGLQVDRADSGKAAIAAFDRAGPGAYGWVLIDWKMPGMDGVTCARALLARETGQQPCILLVTADGREAVLHAAAGLNLAGVLQKPVTPSSLYECLMRARPDRRDGPPLAGPPQPMASLARHGGADLLHVLSEDDARRLVGARVLLVEDHPLNQELASELLRRAGVTVMVADNGREALARLADQPPFDAVLMDCQMPVQDGYETTRSLRSDPRWQTLPVIAMTASALAEDRDRALAGGMNAHLTKPLDVALMLHTLARWIAPRRPHGDAVEPSATTTLAARTSASSGAGHAAALDTTDGLARCLGNATLYRRVLRTFARDRRAFAEQLRGALQQQRAADARRMVHDLKGLAGTIGAHRLRARARSLEVLLAEPTPTVAAAAEAVSQVAPACGSHRGTDEANGTDSAPGNGRTGDALAAPLSAVEVELERVLAEIAQHLANERDEA